MRLFVSVDLPQRLTDAIADVQADFSEASGLNFTDPEQTHVTLKFLGDVPDPDVASVVDLVRAGVNDAAVAPFTVTVEGLGVFPSLEYISVLWVGITDGSEPLTTLHEAIESHAVAAGFEPEEHAFTPHMTIARMTHAGGKEQVQQRVRNQTPRIGQFHVDEIRLTQSTLTAAGPEYTTIERIPL